MPEEKTIHDPVHGSMRLSGLVLDLIDTPEVQRLRGIRQLGLAHLAFPGANHSRFEHALGVGHLVGRMGAELKPSKGELNLLSAAATLHDIGHAPYSHTLEYLMTDYLGKDHIEVTGDILRGKLSICSEEEQKKLRELRVSSAVDVLERRGVDPREVAQLLIGRHRRRYLGQLIHGDIDVDQMDYLLRDSHFTGVALGMIDIDRLMRTLVMHRGRLAILSKGIEAVEGFLTARALMYTSVYFHHTVRAAEIMLANAVDHALVRGGPITKSNFYLLNDSELIYNLNAAGGYPADIVARLRYRQLFKPAYREERRELSRAEKQQYLRRYGRWRRVRELQDEIADEAGVERGYVILDVPIVDIIISEPRLEKVEVPVLAEGKLERLSRVSPIALALKRRHAPRYFLRVLTEPRHVARVRRAAKKVLD
ncbi:MAG: HD domain-containing protein [Hadesarchaea archaeon]|nr:HD domain-containing protein [Hadesarchaea archaeon]